jgi:hypothetical protein
MTIHTLVTTIPPLTIPLQQVLLQVVHMINNRSCQTSLAHIFIHKDNYIEVRFDELYEGEIFASWTEEYIASINREK